MRFQATTALRLLALILSIEIGNGYILGRLMALRNVMEPEPSVVNIMSSIPSVESAEGKQDTQNLVATASKNSKDDNFYGSTSILQLPQFDIEKQKKAIQYPTFKKSLSLGQLKKYGSTHSRNCFFTPIQCMIQHDMSKYKKLVDSNIQIGTVTRRSQNSDNTFPSSLVI